MGGGWVLPVVSCIFILLAILALWLLLQRLVFPPTARPAITRPLMISPPQYSPQIVSKLVLPETVIGIVGIREWTWSGNVLTSRNQKFIWTSGKMTADRIPSERNQNGLYAYQLGSLVPSWSQHIGIVELLGQVEIHADGVMRGEKCRILAMIVNWGNSIWAREISARYDIPVCIANYPGLVFKQWLLGSDGIKWLNHNFKLLGGEVKFDIVKEAEKMLGGDQ